VTWNKDAKRAAAEARVQSRYEEEREEREKAMMDVRDTQNRVGRAQTYGRSDDSDELLGGRRTRTEDQNARRAAERKRYQFEATGSDDELEDEIDDNLDEIGDMAKRLRALATATGDELDAQNKRIDVISGKTDKVAGRLEDVTRRVGPDFFLLNQLCSPRFLYKAKEVVIDQVRYQKDYRRTIIYRIFFIHSMDSFR
jgi:hypothetical protein